MSFHAALRLAKLGFHVFPIAEDGKTPLFAGFPVLASNDPKTVEKFWRNEFTGKLENHNVGISTSRYGDGTISLIGVDVDNKEGKTGDEELWLLEGEGKEFPETFEQKTPSQGRHLLYWTRECVRQPDLSRSINIRARGGYVLGSGSRIGGIAYVDNGKRIAEAPQWLVDFLRSKRREVEPVDLTVDINEEYAEERAVYYLSCEAPIAVQGASGDTTTFAVACRLKDFGVDRTTAYGLLLDHWNDRCEPPWDTLELDTKVENAYRYGKNPIGVAAPERQFEKVEEDRDVHPFDRLNKEYAFVLAGGGHHVLWETVDVHGNPKIEHLSEASFHRKFAADVMTIGDAKTEKTTKLWMNSPKRRSYDGFCFRPGIQTPPNWYNLWRGFSSTPMKNEKRAKAALDAFLEHARDNVCGGDKRLFKWLMGYFAHLVQKPWEKPLVALVFRGSKGVGKNALVDCVGHLLGAHYLLTSNRRYLVGNFNGHLENCLLFALDEAFWSGDKQAEGTLKDLITGRNHVVEHKGKEPYTVENCTRVVIIGNEDWLVPASQDERRFAVFDVGEGRKQDKAFFVDMREGMESGGYDLLLSYLRGIAIAEIDVNEAPKTKALLDQKVRSLDPFHQWWLECLHQKQILLGDFGSEWHMDLCRERFRHAYNRYFKDRNIRSRTPDERMIGRLLKQCLPSIKTVKARDQDDNRVNAYRVPPIERAREEWEKFIGHPVEWDED